MSELTPQSVGRLLDALEAMAESLDDLNTLARSLDLPRLIQQYDAQQPPDSHSVKA